MEFKEFSAKTADEAIIKASIELGVSSENLEIQVVTEGSSGFFGIGKKPAIIKARRKEETLPEEPVAEEIKESVPVKKEVKADVSGIYITGVKGVRGSLETPPKKQGFFKKMRAKANQMTKDNSKK